MHYVDFLFMFVVDLSTKIIDILLCDTSAQIVILERAWQPIRKKILKLKVEKNKFKK